MLLEPLGRGRWAQPVPLPCVQTVCDPDCWQEATHWLLQKKHCNASAFFFLIFCKIFAWRGALVLGQTQDSQTCQPCLRVLVVWTQALCELLLRPHSCTEEVSGFQGVFTNFFLVYLEMLVIYTASEWKCFSSWHHCSVIISDNTAVFLLASAVLKLKLFFLGPEIIPISLFF